MSQPAEHQLPTPGTPAGGTATVATPISPLPPPPPPAFATPTQPAAIPSAAPAAEPEGRRARPKRRFLAGMLLGATLAGLVAAGICVWRGNDGPAASPATNADADTDTGPREASTGALITSFNDLAVQARPSIVAIHTTVTQTDVFGREVTGDAAGTGWVVDANGLIVTNAHVVEGAEKIIVALNNGEPEVAELVSTDPRADLAVLRIDRSDLTPLPIGDSSKLRVGDVVVAIGNALDLGVEPTVTDGIVSAKDRSILTESGNTLVDLIQTSAAINPGNSGGPLLDLSGRVVGINTAVSGQGQNIGFAISIDSASRIIESLRNGDVPQHALLGVTTELVATTDDTDIAPNALGASGAKIIKIAPGSSAAGSDLRTGDVILEVDGDPIGGPTDLAAAIASRLPGDEITILIGRGNSTKELRVVLGAHDQAGS